MKIVCDVENTISKKEKGSDFSPFHPDNKLVTVGFRNVDTDEVAYFFLNHTQRKDVGAFENIQSWLDKTTLLIGHNLKHDLQWLLECGFKYDGACYDTMITEYVLARGQPCDLSLAGSAIRRKVTPKKKDLIQEYFDKGISVDVIPVDVLEEYGMGDCDTTAELYIAQQKLLKHDDNNGLVPTINLSNEFLSVLTDMERNGIKIDVAALDEIEKEYLAEQHKLQTRLKEISDEVMGDTPINLASPEQLSWLVYSRRVNDKARWAETFNIGTDIRNKPLRRPNMSAQEFAKHVRDQTSKLRKTTAKHCHTCNGTGQVYKTRKDGTQYARSNKCKDCDGRGFVYHDRAEYAGFKMSPRDIWDCTVGGFATDKDTLTYLAGVAKARGDTLAEEFLTGMVRLNAIDTYLSSFVGGIRRNVRADKVLHAKFNQCVTATGRLSSSDPNFQNQPRGKTFPVRRCVVSRWQGGHILEGDFAQLEFRVAGELSGDSQVKLDVEAKADVHSFTAKVLTESGQPTDRQGAKSHTFKPLT